MASQVVELLIRKGLLKISAYQQALRDRRAGVSVEVRLVELGLTSERALVDAYCEIAGLLAAELEPLEWPESLRPRLDRATLERLSCFPLRPTEDRRGMLVALVDPFDKEALEAIKQHLGVPVQATVIGPSSFKTALHKVFGGSAPTAAPREPPVAPASVEGGAAGDAPSLSDLELRAERLYNSQRRFHRELSVFLQLLVEKNLLPREEAQRELDLLGKSGEGQRS